jgi:hypothetical protein
MLAGRGECVSDLGSVREQEALFGKVASDSTAFRVIDRVASEPGLPEASQTAHARARRRAAAPRNAGANTADDHVAVLHRALAQISARDIEALEILVRADSAAGDAWSG